MRIALLFIISITFAQAQKRDVFEVIKKVQPKVSLNETFKYELQAKENASKLIMSLSESVYKANKMMDQINEQDWFWGMDIFVYEDVDAAMAEISDHKTAYYLRNPGCSVVIDISHDYHKNYCIVSVYTITQ